MTFLKPTCTNFVSFRTDLPNYFKSMKSISQKLILVFCLHFMASVPIFAQWTEHFTPEDASVKSVVFFDNRYWGLNQHRLYESYDGKFWKKNDQIFPINSYLKLTVDNGNMFVYNNWTGSFLSMSTDTAKTWTTYDWAAQGITNLKQLLISGNTLLRVSGDEVFRSTDFGVTWQNVLVPFAQLTIKCMTKISDGFLLVSDDKIYKSTNDGLNWVSSPPLYVDPLNSPTVTIFDEGEATFIEYYNYPLDTVFRSMDEGQNWELLPQDWDLFNIASTGGRLFNYIGNLGMAYSLDHGDTWIQVPNAPSNYYDIVKGNEWLVSDDVTVYRSENLEDWEAGIVGVERYGNFNYSLDIISNGDELLLLSDNAIYKTDNEGITWDFLGPFYSTENTIYKKDTIIFNDWDIIRSFDNGKNWDIIPSDDHYMTKFQTGNFLFATTYAYDSIYRSSDWGATWKGLPLNVGFFSTDHTMAYDQSKILGANYNGIFKSTNFGQSFTSLNAGLGNDISSIDGIWGTGDGSFFVATFDKKIYRLVNNSWVPVAGGLTDANGFLKVTPTNIVGSGNSIVMTGYSDVNEQSMIFYSKDKGINWIDLTGTIPIATTPSTISVTLQQNKIFIKFIDGLEITRIYSLAISDVDFQTYTGLVFNDKNANGQKETDEEGLPSVKLKLLSSQFLAVSDSLGAFSITAFTNSIDSVTAIPNTPYASLTTLPAPITSGNLLQGITYQPNIYDLCLDAALSSPLRPGFTNKLYLTLKNIGTENTDGWVKFIVPSGINMVSTNPVASVTSGDSICWNFNNLAPLASLVFTVTFVVETNVAIGDIINLKGITGSNFNDANELNNASNLRETVVGSYDPNDKKCLPEFITPEMALDGEQLKYTIRFQNTGNYPATFVRIIDTLEANLDLSSIEILSASHAFTWTLNRENVLDIFFDNINLPDSTNDEPNSHGFVQFSINVKKGLQLGDNVQNRAFIYFDYNVPVETNTANTNVRYPVWTTTQNKVDFDFEVSPNPGNGSMNLTFQNLPQKGVSKVSVLDTSGKLIWEKDLSVVDSQKTIRLNDLTAGSYLVLVKNGNDIVSKKWVSF
jgi:uncharacterized repeat protein (TIGR01451 family)